MTPRSATTHLSATTDTRAELLTMRILFAPRPTRSESFRHATGHGFEPTSSRPYTLQAADTGGPRPSEVSAPSSHPRPPRPVLDWPLAARAWLAALRSAGCQTYHDFGRRRSARPSAWWCTTWPIRRIIANAERGRSWTLNRRLHRAYNRPARRFLRADHSNDLHGNVAGVIGTGQQIGENFHPVTALASPRLLAYDPLVHQVSS